MVDTVDKLLNRRTQWIPALWQSAKNEHLPVALWRLPKQTKSHIIIDLSGKSEQIKVDLEELPAGFAFSPFMNEEAVETRFLRADLHLQFSSIEDLSEETVWQTLSTAFTNAGWQPSAGENFLQQVLQHQPALKPKPKLVNHLLTNSQSSEEERQRYLGLVEQGIEAIRQGNFQKVALSRSREVTLPTGFDVLDTFERLCITYPDAFVSLVSVPKVGVWMGASPEILISVDEDKLFRTVSLAGTQAVRKDASVKEAHWTHKEIEEQALVSRYIVNCFKKIRLREYEENGPKTIVAGNLMHLRTDFTVDTQAVNFPQLGTVMLELLHPTSAVCGMPKTAALDFIRRYEGCDRQFYSGFLGPVNVEQQTHLFVNLRCMQVNEQVARLYAGAGITAESIPEKEWQETEMKCQTMLNVL